jgi:tetratricopeptide (TPR) repeat protein
VARWLRDETEGRWVLILDNLDDDTVLSTPEATAPRVQTGGGGQLRRPLSAYLPQSQNGVILITTRTRSVATKLVEPRDIIPVDPMTDLDAIKLLQKKLDGIRDEHDLKELASILEYMPLAIVQAAAYIQEKGPRYSVRQYIRKFQWNEKQKTSLLNYEAGQLRRDPEAKNSIVNTWQISFDDIREKSPASADLLSLMSYFDRQGIPEEVLKVQTLEEKIQDSMRQSGDDGVRDNEKDEDEKIRDDSVSEAISDGLFEEAVERLRSYSFVSIGEDGQTFEMHGLVQLATRKWLQIHGEDEKWKARFCRKLNAVFPTSDHKNWGWCEMLFPHAKSAEMQRPVEATAAREWAQLLRKAGCYALIRGNYREAERMCEKSAVTLAKILSGEDVETLSSLAFLASTYWSQGRWTESEKLEVQVMEITRKVLGEGHPDTLRSMANLALTYRDQGRWTEAEQMNIQVIDTSRKLLGEEHPDTLTCMANLATIYWNQGQWTDAENRFMQVIEISQRLLGEEHPNTLTNMANLASTYQSQGRWKESEKINLHVIESRKRVLGEEHPDTLTSINNLASMYWSQGRWTDAEKMQVQVMETGRKVLGEEHPDTLTSMNNLASTYWNQGRWTDAEKIQVQVLETRKRVLGDEHPDTLTSMANLASTYWNQGQLTNAEKIDVQVIETSKRVLGDEHPSTLSSMANLASTYRNQGQWTEAEKIGVQVMETRKKVLGEEHPDALTSMANLTLTY